MNNYFIAIKLPSDIVASVFSVGAQINEFSKSTIVSYENLHISLKFLGGALSDRQVEEVKSALQSIKSKIFLIQLRSIGAFPSQQFARVIWLGVEESKPLFGLRKQIDAVLPPLSQADVHNFVPHLTLSRIISVFDKLKMARFFKLYKKTDFGVFEVKEFYFMMSKTSKIRTTYEVLASYSLVN